MLLLLEIIWYYVWSICQARDGKKLPPKMPSGSDSTHLGILYRTDFSKITPGSFMAEDILGAISAEIFFSWYRSSFGGSKFNTLSRWCLGIWICLDKSLGVDPIWKIYTFFFIALYGSASILRPKKINEFPPFNYLNCQNGIRIFPFQKNDVRSEEKSLQ